MSDPAPLFEALADGPGGGGAVWLRASDGVRIRVGYWPGGPLGTVVFLPGRTEYIEKYGRAAKDLAQRGWSMVTLDWRGQGLAERGLAERGLADPMLGHVDRFSDYQRDLDAVIAWLGLRGETLGLAGPLMLMSHSMGGLIALRALARGLAFRASVFSAPMWGIRLPVWGRPIAGVMRRLPLALPQDRGYAPSTSGQNYILGTAFADNQLTGDQDMWSWLRDQLEREPGLRLGGPSLGWLRGALRECADMARLSMPQIPSLVALGSLEQIVTPGPIRRRMARWPGGRIDIYAGARHEVPMEGADHRARFYNSAHELFLAHRD